MSIDPAELARLNLLGVFGERDPEARAAVARRIYTDDVAFADPDGVVVGVPALTAKAGDLLAGAPGFVFAPVGEVRVVQDVTVLPWTFGPPGAAPVVQGMDICVVEDGRIARMYTLVDAPAA